MITLYGYKKLKKGADVVLVSSQQTFTCSKPTIETLKKEKSVRYVQRWRLSGLFIVNFEDTSDISLVLLLLTLNK